MYTYISLQQQPTTVRRLKRLGFVTFPATCNILNTFAAGAPCAFVSDDVDPDPQEPVISPLQMELVSRYTVNVFLRSAKENPNVQINVKAALGFLLSSQLFGFELTPNHVTLSLLLVVDCEKRIFCDKFCHC